jgi:hypothetical protein
VRGPRREPPTSDSTCLSNRPRDHSSGYGVRDASTPARSTNARSRMRMQDHECKPAGHYAEGHETTNRQSSRRIHDHWVPLQRQRTTRSKKPQVRLTFRASADAPAARGRQPDSASQIADGLSRPLVVDRSTGVDCAGLPSVAAIDRARLPPNRILADRGTAGSRTAVRRSRPAGSGDLVAAGAHLL